MIRWIWILGLGTTLCAGAAAAVPDIEVPAQDVAAAGSAPPSGDDAGGGSAGFAAGRFENYLDGVMEAQFRDYKVVGATFALVRDHRLVFSKGYGVASLDTGAPVDPAVTLFRPGSVSKLFTWTSVMQLVEQGRMDLNAPISEYVSQFEVPNAFDTPMTLNHIMTHTPGLEDGAAGYLFADEVSDLVPLADSLAAHVPAQVRPPGTYASYSNWATALAGLAVANVSGERFEDYVARHIFEPLGMRHATFEEPLPEGLADDMAQGYMAKEGGVTPMGFEFVKNFGPAGALSAAADDMALFMIAHVSGGALPGGGRILSPETTAFMHERFFAHDERVAGMAHGFYEIFRNGERFVGHGGDTIAFHSELVIQPETGFGLFVSFNTPGGAEARPGVVDAVLDYFYPGDGGAEPAFPDEPLAGSAERIKAVSGAYRFNRRSYTKLEGIIGLGGDLIVRPSEQAGQIFVPGEQGGRFIEVAPYEFRQQQRQARLVFQTDDGGNVARALVSPLPVMVADRLAFWQTAANHQLIIGLGLLAAFFVLLNAVRNRGRVTVGGTAGLARLSLMAASASFLIFVAGLAVVFGNFDINDFIFDFPPPGTAIVLVFPVLGALFTVICIGLLVPVWRSPECNVWQRLRYTYVALVFLLLLGVLAYWNLLGWRY
ncbi:MAG: serine hydrolase domain-containing protein [Pseudomonadales bacterium]|jgi:CubicO group peptidase (beta-lactamase class C family)